MAAKENSSESEIDKTSFFWAGQCGACHPGGGPAEFDRDGELYWDATTGQYGYEKLGKTAAEVQLDGDYAFINPSTGGWMAAPWHVTGVTEPDCLECHRADRTIVDGVDRNTFWRQATLRAMGNLVDAASQSVPAYTASATAAQGWHSTFELASLPPGKPPTAATLQIDYGVGIADGSVKAVDGQLYLAGASITSVPKDYACWGCHSFPDLKKRGRVWFRPDQDVHYAGFNHLTDSDPANDVAPEDSRACNRCHPDDGTHNFGKGNAFAGSVRDDLDYAAIRTCRDCHLEDSPDRDPEAPVPGGTIHAIAKHRDELSCQLCHVPYKTDTADLVVDNATTGATITYRTDAFLSSVATDPTFPDDSRWYPAILRKTDEDGEERMFPAKYLNTVWWGDWQQNGTPGDTTDDIIEPIILWRLRQVTGGAALPGTADDNGDGIPEVNSEAEILNYITTLRTAVDSYGNAIAAEPVLIKGGKVWYEDPANPGTIATFELEGSGIHAESGAAFAMDHNVLPKEEAFGVAGTCGACHYSFNGWQPTKVFDRKVLIDPFGPDGQPVYETPREMLDLPPFN